MFDLKIDRMTSKYGERKHKETSALLYLSQYFDDTQRSVQQRCFKSNKSKQSSEEASSWHAMLPSPQFAEGCFHVRGSFITCRIDALHVNDMLCCIFLSK